MSTDLYETDIALWSDRQAEALRRRAFNEIDWINVAEEIADVGKRDRDRINGALRTALVHLLEWQFQPEARSNAWRAAVVKARERITKLIEDSPSLQAYLAEQLTRAFAAARRIAEAETELVGLPEACPWTVEQVLDHAFWPRRQ
jgi:Domain of unknown function DUF29